MASADIDRTLSRLINATTRIVAGIRLQRSRILDASEKAPRLLEGTSYEVRDLTGAPHSDLDYYVYELGRLQDVARATVRSLDKPPEIVAAMEEFDRQIPNLRRARNPLTHQGEDERLDDVAWFSALVRLEPMGAVEYLVDPRETHHEAAEALASALLRYLRERLQQDKTD